MNCLTEVGTHMIDSLKFKLTTASLLCNQNELPTLVFVDHMARVVLIMGIAALVLQGGSLYG